MMYKIIVGNELYVYMNGSLLYKRWIDKQYGMVMDRQPFTAKDVFIHVDSIGTIVEKAIDIMNKSGKLVNAVKYIMKRTGWCLKTTIDFADEYVKPFFKEK